MMCPKIALWYIEAKTEKKQKHPSLINMCRKYVPYIIYPESWYKHPALNVSEKIYDFTFMGSIYPLKKASMQNRSWIIQYITQHFTNKSYLMFTDVDKKIYPKALGVYDHTLTTTGFCPYQKPIHNRNYFDTNYYETLAKSKFCLCPGGDALWSMRFYEALMCKCMPIVYAPTKRMKQNKLFIRSSEERRVPYHYLYSHDMITVNTYNESLIEDNYELFRRYHTL